MTGTYKAVVLSQVCLLATNSSLVPRISDLTTGLCASDDGHILNAVTLLFNALRICTKTSHTTVPIVHAVDTVPRLKLRNDWSPSPHSVCKPSLWALKHTSNQGAGSMQSYGAIIDTIFGVHWA